MIVGGELQSAWTLRCDPGYTVKAPTPRTNKSPTGTSGSNTFSRLNTDLCHHHAENRLTYSYFPPKIHLTFPTHSAWAPSTLGDVALKVTQPGTGTGTNKNLLYSLGVDNTCFAVMVPQRTARPGTRSRPTTAETVTG